ncbi:MAG: hypothetical protein HOV81_43630 [Kofleriaceae bacterium]|nr:hypothetical protein [Kofleriaceae bacterium]
MRSGLVLLIAAAIAAPGSAHAGRSFYGWLHGTEVMPERGVELQTWIGEENRVEDLANRAETWWGVGPFIGITDQLEIGLPLNVAWFGTPGGPAFTALYDYGLELRYRMVTQDPEDAPPFAPLVRVAVNRLVLERDTVRPEVNIIASYEAGSAHLIADVNFVGEISRDAHHFEVHPGVGASFNLRGDLRLGAEAFAQISMDDDGATWAIVGPNLSWTHGRTWVSVAYGIGVYQIKDAPRMQWGIAF